MKLITTLLLLECLTYAIFCYHLHLDGHRRFGKFYLTDTVDRSYEDAKSWCHHQGLQLVLPQSDKESRYIRQIQTKKSWLRIPSSTNGTFELDFDGNPLVWSNWMAGEPETYGDPECWAVQLLGSRRWVAYPCNSTGFVGAICEIKTKW